MRRTLAGGLAALLVTQLAWGQVADSPVAADAKAQQVSDGGDDLTPRAVAPTPPLQREHKIRYLLRQLNLTPLQQEQAEGLIETVYNAEVQIDLARVQELMTLMQKAQADEDQVKFMELQADLRSMGEQASHEPEFFDNLELNLTEEQRRVLARQQERLERNPSGAVRPVDVFDELMLLDLTADQKKLVIERRASFRRRMEKTAPTETDNLRMATMLQQLINRIKKDLTPTQVDALSARIDALRVDKLPTIEQMEAEIRRADSRARARHQHDAEEATAESNEQP